MPIEDEPVAGVLSATHSIEMLKAVIDGETLQRVADRFGVTRSAVERRVKVSIRHLIESVGVEGLTAESAAYVHRLRKHRDSILIALSHFLPFRSADSVGGPRVVSDRELAQAIKLIGSRSNCPLRDQALLCILFVTGARPLEIARLEVRDFLRADGSVRTHSEFRAEVAITGKARPLYFMSERLNELLSAYLAERVVQWKSELDPDTYRGLDPESRLFVAQDGQGFPIVQYGQAGQRRYLCQAILELYRKLFKQSELRGISPLSARRTVAARLYERGALEEQVGLLLGVGNRNAVKDKFPRRELPIEEIVRD